MYTIFFQLKKKNLKLLIIEKIILLLNCMFIALVNILTKNIIYTQK